MDSTRTVGQLNSVLYASYRARLINHDCIIEEADADFYTILGVDLSTSANCSMLELVLPSDAQRLNRDMQDQLNEGNELELIMMTRSGNWVLNRAERYEADGEWYLDGVLVTINRLQKIYDKQKQRLMEYAERLSETTARASRDSLTMLYNAKTTRTLCEEYVLESDEGFALMILDVDGFKNVNDSYGHSVGDKVLGGLASIVKKLFRSGDVVGRIGGDEFLVLMKGVEQRDVIERKSQQLIETIADTAFGDMPKGNLSCSVGIVFSAGDHSKKYDELFCIADRAMYTAKFNGGNQYNIRQVD